MKKFLTFLMAFALLLGVSSCTSCNKEVKQMENMVETVIKSDLNYMSQNYGVYVWYESSLTLNDYLDAEDCTGTVAQIVNIFQTGFNDSTVSDQKVVMITHNDELMFVKEIQGFWCEDLVLDTAEITYTYRQAYERLMATDCIKPHSKFCVLRKPLGPYPCNAQYIFGNANDDLQFVDAVTGDVSDENPAFTPRE